ncbi:MAG: glycosyltransferase family 4 protein [Crocinitomicaceae bacterium]|nr:glycosyltransferase family 4 protein [Crocinitomicaceae bacterium]MBP6032362.1 glycosyltransferase family 4 protein [Crocinitomicaceae bacterium]
MRKKINIAVWWVRDYETGTRDTLGGLERWTRDIVRHLVMKGYEVNIYQKSKVLFEDDYNGGKLYGVVSSKNFIGNITFYQKIKKLVPSNELVLFLSQDLVWGSDFKKSVAVNHGVWWSSRQNKIKRWLIEYFNGKYLRRTQKTICVDTNYINWVIESVQKSHDLLDRMVYIPNYFDDQLFKTNVRNINTTVIKILFPRRIMGLSIFSEPRGGSDCINAVAKIIKEGYNVHLTMLGEGNLTDNLKQLTKSLGIEEFVEFKTAQFDEIASYYEANDVVMVPSRFSEGTSLSAIEALASNCFVISSCVGGLQNLPLFPPYGIMTEPHPEKLAESLKFYITNRKKIIDTEKNVFVLDQFRMENWSSSVMSILEQIK